MATGTDSRGGTFTIPDKAPTTTTKTTTTRRTSSSSGSSTPAPAPTTYSFMDGSTFDAAGNPLNKAAADSLNRIASTSGKTVEQVKAAAAGNDREGLAQVAQSLTQPGVAAPLLPEEPLVPELPVEELQPLTAPTEEGQVTEQVQQVLPTNSQAGSGAAQARSLQQRNVPQAPSFADALADTYASRLDLQELYNPDGSAKNPNDPRIAGIPTLQDWGQQYGINESPTIRSAFGSQAFNTPSLQIPVSPIGDPTTGKDPFQTKVDSILKEYGVSTTVDATANPVRTFEDIYKQLYKNLGLDSLKSNYEDSNQALKDLRDKKTDEIAEINNNPWFTEGKRVMEIRKLDEKYEMKESNLLQSMQLSMSMYDRGREDAQFIVSNTMNAYYKEQDYKHDLVLKAIDRAERETMEERKNQIENQNWALEHGIDTPWYKIGKTVYDSTTRMPFYSEADFLKRTGMPVAQAAAQGLIGSVGYTLAEQKDLAELMSGGGLDPSMFKEVQGGLFDLSSGSWVIPPQDKSQEDLNKPLSAQDLINFGGLPAGTTWGDVSGLGLSPERPPTDAQRATAGYALRISDAVKIFDTIEGEISKFGPANYQMQRTLPNWAPGKNAYVQQQEQAERNFINATLRRESGATITPEEFRNAQLQYLPQPGDKPEVLAQKKANRQRILTNFSQEAGPAYTGTRPSLSQLEGGGQYGPYFNTAGNASASNLLKGTSQSVTRLPLLSINNTKVPLIKAYPQGSYPTGQPNSLYNQCGYFVRSLVQKQGLSYPALGDSLAEKAAATRRYGVPISQARVGSVLVTNESKANGHVAYVIGRTPQGFVLAESNYNLDGRVNYGRVIPYNSPSIIGVINPK